MSLSLQKVPYSTLNAKQKEAHNFQKVSAALADYGYSTIRLQDDWQGADFIAQHCASNSFLRVQLKSRLMLHKKYLGKDLYVAFPDKGCWYIYEHDALLAEVNRLGTVSGSSSWSVHGAYSWPGMPANVLATGVIQKL